MSAAMTLEEFYARRDHRTNLYVGGVGTYVGKTVLLTGDPLVLGTYVGQVIAIVSANMLSRWCRHVKVLMPSVLMHPLLGAGSLADAVESIRRLAHELRPPVLDEHGLVGSLREHARDLPSSLQVHVEADPPLPALLGQHRAAFVAFSCRNA